MPHRFYTRRFLNRRGHHAGAYVLASVEDSSRRTDDEVWVDVDFVLTDCSRQVRLDFEVGPGDLASSLHKVDVLLDTLTRFRAALVEEGRLAAERAHRGKAAKRAALRSRRTLAGRPGTGSPDEGHDAP